MGFDKIVAWMGVAVILTISLSAFFLIYNNTVASMHEFYKTDKQMLDHYKTDYAIENASYNESGSIHAYAKNTGKGDILLRNTKNNECIDVLVDNAWISHADFSANVTSNAYDPLAWNPKEYLDIIVNQKLPGGMHTLTLVECHGRKKSIQFRVTGDDTIYFVPPTEDNKAAFSRNWTQANITIEAENIDTFRFNWNGTNYPIYDSSLVLCLNFNNNPAIGENSTNVIDISRNNLTGDMYTGVFWNTSGVFGGSMLFSSSNSHIEVYDPGNLNLWNLPADANISIELWINPLTGSLKNYANIWGNANGPRFQIYKNTTSYNLLWYAGSGIRYSDSIDLSSGAWYHAAIVRTGSSQIRFYLNGRLIGSSVPDDASMNPSIVWIGSDTATEYYRGLMDEFRLYNRSLTQDEIWLHYKTEFQKYDNATYRFYANVTDLSYGTYAYYGWFNDTAGRSGQTDNGNRYYTYS
jgi:archaellum component FlaG (FlaF/FlaG flagellin family)